MVIVEGGQWANNWDTLGDPFDARLIYSFHKYWNNNDQGAIQTFLDARQRWQRPVWVGETGENDDSWYAASFSLLEKNGIGWCFWPWKKLDSGNNPYSVSPPDGWNAIQSFVSGGAKPAAANAQTTLDALVTRVPLGKSNYNEDVVCSLMPCN
jgi:hypothetical protein